MRLNDDLTVNAEDLEEFQRIINVRYRSPQYLIQALTHGSLFNGDSEMLDTFKMRNDLDSKDYEKLEFLGDSVLGLIIAEYAYHDKRVEDYRRSKGKSIEGVSTELKKVLVSNDSLKKIAEKIELSSYVLCEPHVNIEGKLSDIIEALIGSIYLGSCGYEQARKFVYTFFELEMAIDQLPSLNPKGRLKEHFDRLESDFEYRLLCEDGMPHDRTFTVGLFVNEELMLEGCGKKIKDAEKDAAEKYLRTLN